MKVKKYLIWSPLVLAMMSLLVYNSCATYTFQAEDRIGKDATITSSKDIRSVYWELKGCGGPLFKSAESNAISSMMSCPPNFRKPVIRSRPPKTRLT